MRVIWPETFSGLTKDSKTNAPKGFYPTSAGAGRDRIITGGQNMISKEVLKEALGRALATGADYAEVFAEHTRSKNINIISIS